MIFSPQERAYLDAQQLGWLATVRADGGPQIGPVGFTYNEDRDTIDIGGFYMSTSQKFKNAVRNPKVALVVDDVASVDPFRVRCLEIRGTAETILDPDAVVGNDGSVLRIHPERIISFGIDQADQEVHELTPHNRDVA
jgi:pyridoxamine 5'-phosphate oxidase family protein